MFSVELYKKYQYEQIFRKKNYHRVINSSTGAVDGINVEMAIVTGTFAAMVDAEDRNEDEYGRVEIEEENSSV